MPAPEGCGVGVAFPLVTFPAVILPAPTNGSAELGCALPSGGSPLGGRNGITSQGDTTFPAYGFDKMCPSANVAVRPEAEVQVYRKRTVNAVITGAKRAGLINKLAN
jgi:hypothetical protein